jgi:endonuclease/exonuclease/phosphatase family metal-dependent hydrolase
MRLTLRWALGILFGMSTLRVATLNIWNKSGPWAERLALIRGELERRAPAIVGLQEVLRYVRHDGASFEATPLNGQGTEIAHGLAYEVVYAEASDYSHGLKFGNALLSKHPVLETFRFRLPDLASGESRSLLGALVETPFGTLPVFVTHLNWKLHHGAIRLEQVKVIVDRIFEIAPVRGPYLPPVLMGDFNAEPDSDEIRFLRGLKVEQGRSVFFADAWAYGGDGSPGATYCRSNDYARAAREPSRRIDYIFVRGPDALLRGEPVRTELAFATADRGPNATVWPSDHFGLIADLELEPRSP